LTRFVEIIIGQKFYAYEIFVRARFAQMFRRCIEFSALLSVRPNTVGATKEDKRNSSVDSPRRFSITARKTAALSPRKPIAMVHRVSMTLSQASHERSDYGAQSPL
jgi:hypothetical protein